MSYWLEDMVHNIYIYIFFFLLISLTYLPIPVFSFLNQEIGDVENWARSIEMDMRTIATALEYVHKGQIQAASS